MLAVWKPIADPDAYVRDRLAEEADDIPADLIAAKPWTIAEMRRDQLRVDTEMIAEHDANPIHCARRDGFVATIRAGDPIPPLIVLGDDRFLVDGYARYRALALLGVDRVMVLCQRDA